MGTNFRTFSSMRVTCRRSLQDHPHSSLIPPGLQSCRVAGFTDFRERGPRYANEYPPNILTHLAMRMNFFIGRTLSMNFLLQ